MYRSQMSQILDSVPKGAIRNGLRVVADYWPGPPSDDQLLDWLGQGATPAVISAGLSGLAQGLLAKLREQAAMFGQPKRG